MHIQRPAQTFDSAGLWAELRRPVSPNRPALFLDRDGVVVEERHYLKAVEDVALTQGAAEAIARLNRQGVPVIMITNQAGIGRGLFEWRDFIAVQNEIHRQLEQAGASIDAVYACAYHKDGQSGYAVDDHPWRKPNAGMIEAAHADTGCVLSGSWVIGDRATDLQAGRLAGLPGGTLVATGYGADEAERADANALCTQAFQVTQAASLSHALSTVLPSIWPIIRRSAG